MKSPERGDTDHRRLVSASALLLFILCWVKLTPWLGAGLMTTLVPLCVAFAILAWLSPPVAAALFFMGNYLLGNFSIAFYPRVSFLAVIAVVLVGALLYARWKRGELVRFLRLPGQIWWAIAALALFFLIGYVRAIWQLQIIEGDPEHHRSVFTVFQASLRNSELVHYMFLTHWLSFIMIGALACLSYREFKTFFLSFSILFIVQLLSIPFSFYVEFFNSIYVGCQAIGLGYLQVNRAHVGYMAALASALALLFAHDCKGFLRASLLTWSAILSAVVFLSGSRGPVLAWVLVSAFVIWNTSRLSKIRYGMLTGILLAAGAIYTSTGYSVVPCGMIEKLTESRHSIETRLALINDFSLSVQGWGLDTWLFGKGFGGSIRSVDSETRVVRMHSGTLNLPIDLFIETGIIGVTFFVLAMVIMIHYFHRTIVATGVGGVRQIAVALNAMMLVLLVKLTVASDTPTEDLAALMIGLLISLSVVTAALRDMPHAASVCGSQGKV